MLFINRSRISKRPLARRRAHVEPILSVNFDSILLCTVHPVSRFVSMLTSEGLSVLSWKYFVCIANLFVVVMCLDLLFAKERKVDFVIYKVAGNRRPSQLKGKVSLMDRTERKAYGRECECGKVMIRCSLSLFL